MLGALFARIEDQRDALVELTRELVQIPTVNPPGTMSARVPNRRPVGTATALRMAFPTTTGESDVGPMAALTNTTATSAATNPAHHVVTRVPYRICLKVELL